MGAIRLEERRAFLGATSGAAVAVFAGGATAVTPAPHRRVVTGVDASGKSIVVSDGPVPSEGSWSSPQANGADLWFLPQMPVDLTDQRDPIAGYKGVEFPPPGGVILRILTWQPGFAYRMHRSATIDFIVIVSGRLELLLDGGNTTVGPGDCVIQRGTNHGWRVVGSEPCTFVGVAVGAKA